MIVSTFALLGIDSGFTAMSSGVRVPSEFAVHTLLDNFPVEPSTDKDSCTKSVYKCIRKGMPLYTLRRRYYRPVRWMLRRAPADLSIACPLSCELELELIQTQMKQKPMLRAEVGMRVRCANKASAE